MKRYTCKRAPAFGPIGRLVPLIVVLLASVRGEAQQPAPAPAPAPAPTPAPLVLDVAWKPGIHPKDSFVEALTVTVKSGDKPVPKVKVTATVLNTSVRLFKSGDPKAEVAATTDDQGIARISVDTQNVTEQDAGTSFAVTVSAEAEDGRKASKTSTPLISTGFNASFLSDRVASEIFLGGSLARSYDADGNSEGFKERAWVGRLRIDTLWTQSKKSGFHTGIEIELSSFPTKNLKGTGDSITDYADSFTGSLVVVYQPGTSNWYRQYTKTSKNKAPELRYDALRLGVIGRFGLISRAKKDTDGDTDLQFFRVGLLFTHHQTAASKPEDDNVNVFPLRYVEVSYGHYEQIFDQLHADRLVVEAGFRLPGIGHDALPFYGGIYLNAGKGQDDLRVFAGLLFDINKLAKLFGQ